MSAPVDLDAILGPIEAGWVVRFTRETRNGYFLTRYLAAGHRGTPEIAKLVDDICADRLRVTVDETTARPLPSPEAVEREIARVAAAIRVGDREYREAVRALALSPARPTEAAIELVACFLGLSPRTVREIRHPQSNRLKRRPKVR